MLKLVLVNIFLKPSNLPSIPCICLFANSKIILLRWKFYLFRVQYKQKHVTSFYMGVFYNIPCKPFIILILYCDETSCYKMTKVEAMTALCYYFLWWKKDQHLAWHSNFPILWEGFRPMWHTHPCDRLNSLIFSHLQCCWTHH